MTPESIKRKVQDAYLKAMGDRSTQWQPQSGIQHLLRDVKIFGREAGVDFAETNLEGIVREAVAAAECKEASLTLTASGCGRAAARGMAESLAELTGLKVDATGQGIRLTWGDTGAWVI